MKQTSSGPVYSTIRSSHLNNVVPVLTAEWNMNRYYATVVDNTPSEDTDGYDIEMFPIESVVRPDRPTAGIIKAAVGQSYVAQSHYDDVPSARYYTASVDDVYKYWQSPITSNAIAPYDFATHTDGISKVRPRVEYNTEPDSLGASSPVAIKANKIVIGIETTFSKPDSFDVQIKTSTSGSWVTISSNPIIQSNGRVELWYNGVTWSTTQNLDNITDVYAIQIVVNSMDKASAYFNLIEMGARLELDLSTDLSDASDSASLAESDFITPLGTVSSNTGSVTLFNDSEKYTNDNPSSILYGLLDKNVKFNLEYRYDNTNDIQQFELFSDSWTETLDSTSVSLVDGSRYLMDTKAPVVLYQDISVQEAIWRLCDAIGFNKYEVDASSDSAYTNIDVFWTTGEETVWEVFQELSRGTQTAIYFDSYGVLQVKTRQTAFNSNNSAVWTLRETISGTELPDIISLNSADKYESNKVTIKYQPTGFSERINNIIPFEVVWEPDGDTVLRSSKLRKDMTSSENYVYLTPEAAKTWPWKGMCQIDGEWISYEGKKYTYYNGSTKTTTTVKSLEEQKRCDAKTPESKKHLNAYNGVLVVTERGLWNTEAIAHTVSTASYNHTVIKGDGGTVTPAAGFRQNKTQSTVTLSGPDYRNFNSYFLAWRGSTTDQGYYRFGTRMKIDKTGHKHKTGGIMLNGGALGNGYFIDVMATARMTATMRKSRNEVMLYSRKSDGTWKAFGGERVNAGGGTKKDIGAEVAVVQGVWLDIDVQFSISGTSHVIQVYVNGRLVIDTTISAASGWQQAFSGRIAMYARGHSSASFEYLYGLTKDPALYLDEETLYDRIRDGYVGNQWERAYVYEVRTVRRKIKGKWTKIKQRYNQRFFDEFGPYVHELRQFDVKFDTNGMPVLESKLYNSNETQTVCTEFVHDVAGASFILANTSRFSAVVNGDDMLTAGSNNAINQKLMVYGRPVIQKDAETIVKTDDWAIRRRGVIETEYASKWTQNKDEAEALATWLTTNWTRSDSELTVEIFGNPLIELTDIVSVEYKELTAATNKYYVTGIETDFSQGISTTLTLRRAS